MILRRIFGYVVKVWVSPVGDEREGLRWKDPLGLSLPARARFEADGGRRNGFPMVASVLDACADAVEQLTQERDALLKTEHYVERMERRITDLKEERDRARFIAEHLFQMIPQSVWRDTGGDDMQGHYEGDYHAEQVAEEIRGWAVLSTSREESRYGHVDYPPTMDREKEPRHQEDYDNNVSTSREEKSDG